MDGKRWKEIEEWDLTKFGKKTDVPVTYFYCGTSHGPVSVHPSVTWLNVGSHKQHHTIAQGLKPKISAKFDRGHPLRGTKCRGVGKHFNWHNASRSPSAIAELHVLCNERRKAHNNPILQESTFTPLDQYLYASDKIILYNQSPSM